MSPETNRVWFTQPLETVATWWRVLRADGVTLGFTTHDADLWFDGVLHSAAPGMTPAAIKRSASFDADSAEVEGAISHDAITAWDLVTGRYDGAEVIMGLVDWETLEHQPIYNGTIGSVSQQDIGFSAELQSRKVDLLIDPVPNTSPNCRADFCGKGCGLSVALFTHEAVLVSQDMPNNAVTVSCTVPAANLVGGVLRWLDGPYGGIGMVIIGLENGALVLDSPVDVALAAGLRMIVTEGCDHTLGTCAGRFANAVNFQGEPYLPGNDLVMRYGVQ